MSDSMFTILDQIFLWNPVVLESICYRTRAKQLINESNTTGGLIKIWTGIPYPFLYFQAYLFCAPFLLSLVNHESASFVGSPKYVTTKPVQIFLSPPVIMLQFISRYALVRLQIDSYTIGSQKKLVEKASRVGIF